MIKIFQGLTEYGEWKEEEAFVEDFEKLSLHGIMARDIKVKKLKKTTPFALGAAASTANDPVEFAKHFPLQGLDMIDSNNFIHIVLGCGFVSENDEVLDKDKVLYPVILCTNKLDSSGNPLKHTTSSVNGYPRKSATENTKVKGKKEEEAFN